MSEEIDAHVVRKYEIGERVGKGAYGIVWKATDRKTGVSIYSCCGSWRRPHTRRSKLKKSPGAALRHVRNRCPLTLVDNAIHFNHTHTHRVAVISVFASSHTVLLRISDALQRSPPPQISNVLVCKRAAPELNATIALIHTRTRTRQYLEIKHAHRPLHRLCLRNPYDGPQMHNAQRRH
jgi:hypothetical protein